MTDVTYNNYNSQNKPGWQPVLCSNTFTSTSDIKFTQKLHNNSRQLQHQTHWLKYNNNVLWNEEHSMSEISFEKLRTILNHQCHDKQDPSNLELQWSHQVLCNMCEEGRKYTLYHILMQSRIIYILIWCNSKNLKGFTHFED